MRICVQWFWWGLLSGALVACGSEMDTGNTEPPQDEGQSASGSSDEAAGTIDGITVEVGIFKRTGENSYEQLPNNPFSFTVGERCQSWSRRVTQPSPMDSIQTEHDHFNAADEVSWNSETRTITWLEYGPEHSQDEIDETCAAAQDGAFKEVNDTDYYFDGNQGETNDAGEYIGFYLKVISVTGE